MYFKYFDYYWYKYLFAYDLWNGGLLEGLNRLFCRLRGHPCGTVFYNPGGLEPDYTCKNCGDEL